MRQGFLVPLLELGLQLRDELKEACAELAKAQREAAEYKDSFDCSICYARKVAPTPTPTPHAYP